MVTNREAKAKEEVQLAWSSAETKYFTDWTTNTSVDKDDYYGDEVLLTSYTSDTGTVESSVKNSDGKSWTVKYRAKDQNQLYTFIIDEKGNIVTKKGGISLKSQTKLKKNQEEILEATLDGITGNVSWESSAPEVVSVTGNGTNSTIRALADTGSAVIKAKIAGTIYEDTCTVTIVQKVTTISAEAITVEEGKTKEILVTTTPTGDDVEDLTYTYESNDTATATVDETTGIVTGVAAGSTTITITGKNDENETVTTSCAVTVVEPLKIGSVVTYEPSNTTTWKAKYASSDLSITKEENGEEVEDTSNDVTLSSKSGGSFRITSWKVLRIDESTGTVELVPSAPTTGTVRLQGPQGYNNGVKLLNDACSELYGGTITKEGKEYTITARSINIEDFEGKNGTSEGRTLTDDAITERDNYTNTNDSTESVKYNGTHAKSYSKSGRTYRNSDGYYIIYKNYPVMYEREAGCNISAAVTVGSGKESGIGLSRQTHLIARSEGTTASPKQGAKTASTGIKPKQTYYIFGDYSTFSGKFREYESGKTYASLLLPSGASTNYWVASRCVYLCDTYCDFSVRGVSCGYLSTFYMFNSYNVIDKSESPLFPVVSLSSELISVKSGGGFEVK